jgi:hypothetical protein
LPAANDVKVDITIDEVLCFPLQDRAIQRTYDSFDDLPEGPTVKVYAIEEIVIEKLLALSAGRGTSIGIGVRCPFGSPPTDSGCNSTRPPSQGSCVPVGVSQARSDSSAPRDSPPAL